MIKALGYFLEIIRGGLITARHFVTNMWFHVLKVLGIRARRRGAVTFQYPEEKKPLAARHRSLHRLTQREDGKPRCVSCLLCVTVCPSECITVEAAEDPDSEIQKLPAKFVIDMSRCCFCGFCVEACPEDAIRMDTGRIELASYGRGELVYDLDRLLK
jgi:NADH-quinone oxidoreductase subunit I